MTICAPPKGILRLPRAIPMDLEIASIRSALTMETSLAAPPSLQAFLIYYHGIQTRPRVDIRVFPSLSVLFLDRVAPEWIANLPADLQLLRVDRSGIFNLTMFLFQPLPEKPESEDAISCSQLKSMTHLKLSHCAIGELSGLRGTKRLVEREGDDAGDRQVQEDQPQQGPNAQRPVEDGDAGKAKGARRGRGQRVEWGQAACCIRRARTRPPTSTISATRPSPRMVAPEMPSMRR